jgi:hypothetical protein
VDGLETDSVGPPLERLEDVVDHVGVGGVGGVFLTNALVAAARDDVAVLAHVEELELEARGAEVGDEDEH